MAVLVLGALSLSAQEKWYDIRSGILKQVTDDGSGTTLDITIWFDNYGERQTTIQVTHMPGLGDFTSIMIFQGDKMYSINDYKKEVVESGRPQLHYLSEESLDSNKVKNEGTDTVLGKECTIYSYETRQLMRTVTIKEWVWKGFPIKSVMQRGRREVVTEPVDWQENASIPDSVFDPKTYLEE